MARSSQVIRKCILIRRDFWCNSREDWLSEISWNQCNPIDAKYSLSVISLTVKYLNLKKWTTQGYQAEFFLTVLEEILWVAKHWWIIGAMGVRASFLQWRDILIETQLETSKKWWRGCTGETPQKLLSNRAGIEVILDVVYNHTSAFSFHTLADPVYYIKSGGKHSNYSGCGNTFNCNHPIVRYSEHQNNVWIETWFWIVWHTGLPKCM